MKNELVASLFVVLLVGLAIGFGLGYVVYEPRVQGLQRSQDDLDYEIETINSTLTEKVEELSSNLTMGPSTYVSVSLGQKFNWTVAEVVNIEGNLYAYLGYEAVSSSMVTMRLAKWQIGWIELTYSFTYTPPPYGSHLHQNFTLAPYVLQVYEFHYLHMIAQFLGS